MAFNSKYTGEEVEALLDKVNESSMVDVAWYFNLKEESDPEWGVGGNLAMRDLHLAKCGRYLLSMDGSKMAKMSPTDSSVFVDGTVVDPTAGNTMFWGPDLYYEIIYDKEAGYNRLWMSSLPVLKNKLKAPCFGAYCGYRDSDGYLRSIPNVATTGSRTIRQNWESAQALGVNYGIAGFFHEELYLWMMLVSKYGTTDIRGVIGAGVGGDAQVTDWYLTAIKLEMGSTLTMGDQDGNIPVTDENFPDLSNACHINTLGVEDCYNFASIHAGDTWRKYGDINTLFIHESNYVPTVDEVNAGLSPADIDQLKDNEWREVDITDVPSKGSWFFPTLMMLGDKADMIGIASGGNLHSYWGCRQYFTSSETQTLLRFGMYANNATNASVLSVNANNAWSLTSSSNVARLAWKGEIPTLVNGADM